MILCLCLKCTARTFVRVLELDVHIPETCPLRLIAGCVMPPLPTYIECAKHYTDKDIVEELRCWGHDCDVFCFTPLPVVLCVPSGWKADDGHIHYMLCHHDTTDEDGAFLHTHHCSLSEIELMQILYACGYRRASILQISDLKCGLHRVLFVNAKVETATAVTVSKAPPPWPSAPCTTADHSPFFVVPDLIAEDDCVIRFGMPLQHIIDFFTPQDDFPCRDPVGYDFPDSTMQHLHLSEIVWTL